MRVVVKKKQPDGAAPLCIGTEYIKLDAAMKFANVLSSGGEAKEHILNGEVAVNGEICLQRGRKLYPGDRFSFGGQEFLITIHETP